MKHVERIRNILYHVLLKICCTLLVTVTVFALMQVVGRYIFKHTFFWVEEISTMLLCWTVALGVPMMWLYGEHISMDLIESHLPPAGKKILHVIIQIMGFVMGVTCIRSGLKTYRQNKGFSISMLRYDESIRYIWVIVLGILLIIAVILALIMMFAKKEEGEEA